MHMYSVSRTAYLLAWLQVNVYRGLSADVDVQRRQRAVHVSILPTYDCLKCLWPRCGYVAMVTVLSSTHYFTRSIRTYPTWLITKAQFGLPR